jgi:SAM-dependent methyltransferase
MRRLARGVAARLAQWVPTPVWRTLARVVFFVLAQKPPRAALRALLEVESELARRLNEASACYEGGVHVKHRLTRYHDFFAERVQAGEQVLDIGCGVGAVAASVAEWSGADVTAIDLDAQAIADANARYRRPNLLFVRGDALVDLEPRPVDVVILSNVLEHIEDRPGFLRAVGGRFAPGRWLIRVPMIDRDWRVPLRQELGLFAFSDPTHFTEYTRASFEAELASAGLRVCHLQVNWGEIWAEARLEAT